MPLSNRQFPKEKRKGKHYQLYDDDDDDNGNASSSANTGQELTEAVESCVSKRRTSAIHTPFVSDASICFSSASRAVRRQQTHSID